MDQIPPKSYSYKWSYKNFFDDYHDLTAIIYESNFNKNKNFEQVAKNNEEKENNVNFFEEKKSFFILSKNMVSKLKNKVVDYYKSYRSVLFEHEMNKVYNVLCIDQLEKIDKTPFCLSTTLLENVENFVWYTNENEIIVNEKKYIRNPYRESFLALLTVK